MLCLTKLVSTVSSWLSAVNGHLPCDRTNMKTNQLRPKPKKHSLKVACWNIRTILDNANSSHPERRTSFIAHELSRLDIDIASLKQVSPCWRGQPSRTWRKLHPHLVRETIKWYTSFMCWIHGEKFHCLQAGNITHVPFRPHYINSTTIDGKKVIVHIWKLVDQRLTLFCVYAPTLITDAAVKHSFS